MRIRYLFKLKDPIRLEDHWPVPVIMGGELRVVAEGSKATAFEVSFTGQPVDLAPAWQQHETGSATGTIVVRDSLLPFVRMQVEKAFAYLQCYFDVELLIDETDVAYEGETEEEERQIVIKGRKTRREKTPAPISFDMLTRAIMAAERGTAPELEATLAKLARTAMLQERFIDSFRYSFLLIESVYGEGKFKSIQLKQALKDSAELKGIVANALKTRMSPKRPRNSETDKLLAGSPGVDEVIDHLVDKRGFYFHGNAKRKDAWRPHEQEAAETLCLLALEIAMLISHAAAAPMFEDELSQRHFDEAKRKGAILTMNVKFRFRDPTEPFDRDGSMNITVPGTRATPKMAVYVAKTFLERFEEGAPTADLKAAICTVASTGQKIFDFTLHVDSAEAANSQ